MWLQQGETVTPENYLGSWMPEHRRRLLSQIGFGNGVGLELLSLRKRYNAEKNNYAKQALMDQIVNAETRFNRELQGQEQEYRNLARDANYAGAKRMVDEETAAGRGTGLAAMAGNAILSNNHFSHGIINHGRMVAPAGNAVEDALKAYELTGRTPSLSLLQMLAVSDALTQDDYMPAGPFGIQKTIGGYKSMGIAGGSYTGNTSPFAYGGDGSQYARQEAQNIVRDYNWNQDAARSYDASMANKNPLGSYKGGTVQKGPGLEGPDANGWMPDWVPDGKYSPKQLDETRAAWDRSQDYYSKRGVIQMQTPTKSSGKGSGQLAGGGYWGQPMADAGNFQMSNSYTASPNSDGPDPNGWIDGYGTGSRNPQRFDPTVASDEYSPKDGGAAGYRQERNSNPYFDSSPRQMQNVQGAGRSFGQTLRGIGETALAPLRAPTPKSMPDMTFQQFTPAMGIANPKPKIVSGPRPFGGTLSPGWTGNDVFDGPMFTNSPRYNRSQPYTSGFAKEFGLQNGSPSSSFDRHAVDPISAGRYAAATLYGGF